MHALKVWADYPAYDGMIIAAVPHRWRYYKSAINAQRQKSFPAWRNFFQKSWNRAGAADRKRLRPLLAIRILPAGDIFSQEFLGAQPIYPLLIRGAAKGRSTARPSPAATTPSP
ncbi:hypothetical protein [Novosphingobium rosa]|uniref:hypothetical protein n=1 Tax=Novosphingobium rosa TaxID=76978 RepID=UPI0012EE91E9|nr:hypothetical protein [Novosphingobium rosa]